MFVYILIGVVALLCYLDFRRRISHLMIAETLFPGPMTLPIVGNALQMFIYRKAAGGHKTNHNSYRDQNLFPLYAAYGVNTSSYGYSYDLLLCARIDGRFICLFIYCHVQSKDLPKDLFEYVGELIWFYRRSIRFWIAHHLVICLIEPEDVEKVYGSTTHLTKANQYDYLLDWIGRGLLTSFGEKWKKSRKILTPAFHFTILENFLEIFQRNGDTLIKKLEEKIGLNFNVYELIKLYALDNICEAAMGTKLNAQQKPTSDYVVSIKMMCEIVLTRALSPWLWPNLLFQMSHVGSRQRKALSIIHGMTNSVIAQRKRELREVNHTADTGDQGTGIKKRKVFLDILLESSEGGLTDEEIREEVDTFMFEGHDTVTSALSFALYCLAQNPICQEKAYQEQVEIMGDEYRCPSLQDLQNMKYLEMIIKETLRLYPSVPIVGRDINEDITLDERAILPKGCQVLVLIACLHQRRGVWEKPGEFYPEHFELDAIAKRHPYQFIPFSAGPRNCIGMRFAMLEMKSTLSRVLWNFRLLPANPDNPLKLNVDLILVAENGINIKIAPRNKT